MSDETETPWMSWVIKLVLVIFLTIIPTSGLLVLYSLTPWIPPDWTSRTILVSGLIILIGSGYMLSTREIRSWLYSIAIAYMIGLGNIGIFLAEEISRIPVPIFGNAFLAILTICTALVFLIGWFWPWNSGASQKLETGSTSGLITTSSKSLVGSPVSLGSQLFQRRPASVLAIELTEIPHDYAFAEDEEKKLKDLSEQFHSIVRTLTSIPFALRIQRSNWSTRIFFLTWSDDEAKIKQQRNILLDALSYNLKRFQLVALSSFEGPKLEDIEKGVAASVIGVPLSIKDELQKIDPLEAMTGALQETRNCIFQVSVEPTRMSKSKLKSLENEYRREVERSERTISKENKSWLGNTQESKTTVNPKAKRNAEILERRIKRYATPNLYKTSVSCVSWGEDIVETDHEVRRVVNGLVGALRPDSAQDEFKVDYKRKGTDIRRVLAGFPIGKATILTADEAAAYLILPRRDLGIRVTKRERFSSGTRDTPMTRESGVTARVPSIVKWRERAPALYFGHPIDEKGRVISQAEIAALVNNLNMHLGVFGNTRSGKSTSVISLIGQAISLGVNPVILVPSKGYEWRSLIRLFPELRVFTAGRSDIANLSINIWNPPEGVHLTKWVDRVVQVLTLWLPNDDVISMHMEDVIYTVYKNCGWNLETNEKGRPILLPDLVDAVTEVGKKQVYGDEVKSNIWGALVARVKIILRKPSLVRMYNTKEGIPLSELLGYPTIIEMDALAENDKILLMGILTAAVCEYKLANPSKQVTNLLVLEEAHYLLSGIDVGGEANAGVKLQAVNAFIEMLRVLGGTGLGVILIDQSPTSLVPQAIKIPVNLLIHALSNEDDRILVGKHARSTLQQIEHIGGMQVGEAVVYLQHEGEPKNVKMLTLDHYILDELYEVEVDDKAVAKQMEKVLSAFMQSEKLPADIMDRFTQDEDTVAPETDVHKVLERALDEDVRRKLARAVLSKEFREYCIECIGNKNVRGLVDLFHVVAEEYAAGSWAAPLYVLSVALDNYATEQNWDVFEAVGSVIDGDRD
jgi:hypothetical protein